MVALALVGLLAARAVAAADLAAVCEKKKLGVAASATSTMLRCASAAAGRGTAIDAACLATAESRLEPPFSTAEVSGACPTSGAQEVAAAARTLAEDLRSAVGTAPSTCARKKLLAAGKRAKKRLQAEGKHATRPELEQLGPLLAKMETGFAAAMAKAELIGDCPILGDAGPIAATVDGGATAVVDAVRGTLRVLAHARGVSIGAALRDGPLSAGEVAYADTAVRQFDSVTPEFQFMWGNVEPVQGTLNLAPVDVVVDFAEQHGLDLMGSPLVWHLILPPWVAPLAPAALENALTTRIQTLLGLYGDRVDSWVVVNEAISDSGPTLRTTIFLQKLGSGYIAQAFHLARQADPTATLYINDYGIEQQGPKSDTLYDLVAELKQQGVPIDGVGFQMHTGRFFGIPIKPLVQANIQRFVALGLVVRITEMDMQIDGNPFPTEPGERASALALQRQYYRDLVEACVEIAGCVGVDFWGFTDKYTWVNDYLLLDDEPLPFDAGYRPKAAFFGVRDALLGP